MPCGLRENGFPSIPCRSNREMANIQDKKRTTAIPWTIYYFKNFIHNYSFIAAPLFDLLRKDSDFKWTTRQVKAFGLLKEKLVSCLYLDILSQMRILLLDAMLLMLESQGPLKIVVPDTVKLELIKA
ncbi:hypothetical protein RF11_08606 [Thelohanellus kitauei]|uniref:Reverse transcriptase/retrotransposon-derived protein RNase H-like domain-containing protein n=1 Tax=Thelohanellus kitauei TaxID=669202 RepID=A0A0C2MJR8_THEKT|nr:hypothetical protein RF11_08606 [Thelohanellus kitauei]